MPDGTVEGEEVLSSPTQEVEQEESEEAPSESAQGSHEGMTTDEDLDPWELIGSLVLGVRKNTSTSLEDLMAEVTSWRGTPEQTGEARRVLDNFQSLWYDDDEDMSRFVASPPINFNTNIYL